MRFPTFTEFFEVLTGNGPHPWQIELAERACAGDWPDAVDVPTGLGKTSAVTVAIYALAKQAAEIRAERRRQRTTPMRIIHVVNRRSVIDQTYDNVKHLGSMPDRDGRDLEPAREALEWLAGPWAKSGVGSPVVVGRVHGESKDLGQWLRPTGATVITMTPHQLVSRLAFRGLGVSARTRSVHAGLLGVDSLILFDEAQLSPQAVATVRQMLEHQAAASADLGVPRSRLVLLGATIDETTADEDKRVMRLSPADFASSFASEVLNAARPVKLVSAPSVGDSAIATMLFKAYLQQRRRFGADRRIAVMVNTVSMAQQVIERVRTDDADAVLITSRMRPSDRVANMDEIVGAVRTVVATQCLEIGVDLDFDTVLTEAAPYPTLIQRFGRLNRRGRSPSAEGVLILSKDPEKISQGTVAVYGSEPVRATSRLLRDLAVGDVVDLSLKHQLELKEKPGTIPLGVWPAPPRLATFHRGYLGIMATTYPTPWSDFPLDSFIDGPDEPDSLDVLVTWRHDPQLVDSCPPSLDEQVAVPLPALRAMLGSHEGVEISDLDSSGLLPGAASSRLDRTVRVRRDDEWSNASVRDLRPGDVVVLDASLGGYRDTHGWSPSSVEAVSDHSLVAALSDGNRQVFFPVSPETLLPWLRRNDERGFDSQGRHPLIDRVNKFVSRDGLEIHDELNLELHEIAPAKMGILDWEFAIDGDRLIARRARSVSDEKSRLKLHQTLEFHQEQTRNAALLACKMSGVDWNLAWEIAAAAEAHDEGKRHPSFQAYLGNVGLEPAWAKSTRGNVGPVMERRIARTVGHSLDWRHDGLSAYLAYERGLAELTVHLVGSHHGRFRPLLVSRSDGDGQSELPGRAATFAQLNLTWGPWGLAYLEAVLRLSDWLVSAHPEKSFQSEDSDPTESAREQVGDLRVGAMSERVQSSVVLAGLVPTPLTGWFVVAGLLRCAHDAGDVTAAIYWPPGGAGWPAAPVWESRLSLLEVCRYVLESDQWSLLGQLGGLLEGGLARKNQKVGPSVRLRGLMFRDGDAWLVRGLLQDAARVDPARDVVSLSMPAIANNASYVKTAITARDATDPDMLTAALQDPLSGWLEDKCDGGMDRPGIDDGVTGREVKDHRMIRKQFAPAALLGMASMGPAGLDGLGVRRRELRLPLPSGFTTWPELVAQTHAAGRARGWVLRYTPARVGYERLWLGGAIDLHAREIVNEDRSAPL